MLRDLNIVGSGITAISHITNEARSIIAACDKVFYVLTDELMESYILEINKNSESMKSLYEDGKPRQDTYSEMSKTLVKSVKDGARTCGVFYGHPGVFVNPSFNALEIIRREGYSGKMFPGVSAEDCIFSDLEIDPGKFGCQSYEATSLLVYGSTINPSALLVIWQVGAIGDIHHTIDWDNGVGIDLMKRKLLEYYESDHQVIFYEAPIYPIAIPNIIKSSISDMESVECSGITTLVVPPRTDCINIEERIAKKLRLK